jgi:hypothetical protein
MLRLNCQESPMNDLLGRVPTPPDPHRLKQTSAEGPWGGPTYRYRGARIECRKDELVCGLFMAGHPLNQFGFGVVGTITPLVDMWLNERQRASVVRAVPR